MKPLIHSLSKDELSRFCAELNLPAYRADQLWNWLYARRAASWDTMTSLSIPLRKQLADHFSLDSASAVRVEGNTGETRKILVGLPDGEQVEEVLIPAPARRTVCVSSQAGCRRHCAFCASGQAGFRRHLETGEIIGQVLLAAGVYGDRPTHVVFMGIGEPFDNYDAVLKAVRIINDMDGLAIGARRITLSTCGIIPGIRKLADEGLQVELSVSLHAPDDDLRSTLMPVNRQYPLKELMQACADYAGKTRRLITFEYTLIHGVNDSVAQAGQLAALLKGMLARVNLIPLSPVDEFEGKTSTTASTQAFLDTLDRNRINATLRDSKGSSIRAACGQLRFRKKPGAP